MHNLMRRTYQLQTWRRHLVKYFATATRTTRPTGDPNYHEFISQRKAEATRSIVVQVSSEKSFPELYNYCSAFGSLVGAYHYRVANEDEQHYILLEFSSAQEAAEAIKCSAYNQELTGVPAHSPFLWFKAAGKRATKATASTSNSAALDIVDGAHMISNTELNTLLLSVPQMEDQIRVLYERTKLNDLGVRLRFVAAFQVQQAVSGMFPAASAQPFGSSVNGFGKMGCDLDLILRFDREVLGAEATRRRESRLVFHTKENLTNGRSQTQRQMESIGDMLQLFLPGVCHVRRILQARVPIIKYNHEHLNLEVDLSMSNLTGFYMSELLYMFGQLDDRVRPLTFCIRRWAHACGLTNPSPGRWITNFSLTCLVVFYLQQLKQPILPTINALMKSSTEDDVRLTEDGVNCTFGRDLERLGFSSRNTTGTSELLLQFFEFYSQFDFSNRAISLNEGRAISKPDHSALYIVNPLEQALNVSKNVSLEECERLRIEVRNGAWLLESEVENRKLTEKLEASWGLLNLFKTPEKSIIRPSFFFKTRMMEVSELFNQSENGVAIETPPVAYKNPNIRQQVRNIKAQARGDLKQIRLHATGDASTPKGRRSS